MSSKTGLEDWESAVPAGKKKKKPQFLGTYISRAQTACPAIHRFVSPFLCVSMNTESNGFENHPCNDVWAVVETPHRLAYASCEEKRHMW